MSSPTNLPANCFELLSNCQGLALKLWANLECKAMFPQSTSMYQTFTDKDQGLSWELKVAAQERQELFLQEIEASFIAPLPPAGGGRHTGQKRKQTSNLADPDVQVPANRKKCGSKHNRGKFTNIHTKSRQKMQYSVAVPSTREGNSPIPVPLDSVPPGLRALQLQVKKNGTLPTNPTDYFNFAVDTALVGEQTHPF